VGDTGSDCVKCRRGCAETGPKYTWAGVPVKNGRVPFAFFYELKYSLGVSSQLAPQEEAYLMMDLLSRVEASGLGTWMRESPAVWAFPLILTLHTIGLGLVVGCTAVVSLRILGGASNIPLKPLEKFFSIMWFGFALNAVTGLLLFVKDATTVSVSGVFWVKMSSIALAIWILMRIKTKVFEDPLVDQRPVPNSVRALAFVSILLWAVAITAGRLMAYIGPTQPEAGIIFSS
jgi:hypothetical protein